MEYDFCPSCMEEPDNKVDNECNTPPVIEITNPEQVTTFHTVELEGTEADTPMVNGLYRNVIVKFLGNTHTWIYNSDGIPTYVAEEVNNGTLTLKVDGVTKGTFSANQSTDVEISLTDQVLPLYHSTGQNTDGPIDQKVVTDALDTKVDKETGKGLSTNDYTTAEKTKLAGIATGAEVNVQSNWTESDMTSDSYIQNKPTLATVATSGSYNDLSDQPTIPTKTSDLTNDSSFQNATEVGAAITTATTPINTAIDKTVMTDFSVDSNPSTTTITLDKAKQNILSGVTSSSSTALPVASSSQAGVMNSATFNAISTNTANIDSILNGTVALTGIPASPTQAQLTTAWQTATGLTTVINGSKIYDQDNSKIWTYYANQSQWLSTSAGGSVTVSQWTNSALGIIKGSSVAGQVFAENDGTGSVNGWDDLVSDVSDKADSADIGDATLTIQKNGTSIGTFTANASSNSTVNLSTITASSTSTTGIKQLVDESGNNFSPELATGQVSTSNIADSSVSSSKLNWSTIIRRNNQGSGGPISVYDGQVVTAVSRSVTSFPDGYTMTIIASATLLNTGSNDNNNWNAVYLVDNNGNIISYQASVRTHADNEDANATVMGQITKTSSVTSISLVFAHHTPNTWDDMSWRSGIVII